jgi:DNA topoisomerase-1
MRSLGQLDSYKADVAHLLGLGRLIPNEGKKDDPAHPAVYPTGTLPKRQLDNRERKLFDLVVRRFLASFSRRAVKQSSKATVKVGNHRFLLRGSKLVDSGWVAIYKPYAKFEDIILPPLKVGQSVLVSEIKPERKFTQPPPHYNPSSLLRKMEDSEIGTKATRADIIETLYKRGYVTGQQINSTPLASRIIEILDKHCPKVVDVGFTRELEAKIENIERGSETREGVVAQTVDYLKPIIEILKVQEREIGHELTAILSEMREESTVLITPCPQCGSRLKIAKNPRTKKRFIGCSGKWRNNCNYSLPLPQLGTISLLEKSCPRCSFQLIRVESRGRRPLVSCCRCYAQGALAQQSSPRVTTTAKPE